MIRNTKRRARKHRKCDRCGASIVKGDEYIEAWASPNHDGLGNVGWWRLDECEMCASTWGRWPT